MGRIGSTAVALLATLLVASGCTQEAPERGAITPMSERELSPAPAPSTAPGPAESLGLRTGWGPTLDELDRAARLVGELRLPELAGQVIVADWRGTGAPTDMVRRLHLGGVIAFSDNVASTSQIRSVNARLRRTAHRPWPLFLAVDQEGGIVQRVRGAATGFPAFMSAGAADDLRLTRTAARASGAELRGLGFTVDFAPDADVTSGPADPTIGSRSVGSDPDLVAEHVVAAAQGYLDAGVLPVLKHFPGHGSVPADSHVGLPVQTRTLRVLRRIDLEPFRAGVAAGLPAVMVGHLDVRAVDPRVPSSLSRKVVTGLLRHDLGFDGLVVTDSLEMGAVSRRGSARVAVQALRAGNDVALMPADPAAARAGLVEAVRSGALPRERLEQAAARQVALLLHQRGDAGAAPPGAVARPRGRSPPQRSPSSPDRAAAPSSAPDRCRSETRPRSRRSAPPPSRLAWPLAGWSTASRRSPRAGRRSAGGAVSLRRRCSTACRSASPASATPLPRAPRCSSRRTRRTCSVARRRRCASRRTETTAGAMAALVAVLRGDERAPGRLPVEIAGVPRRGC